MGRFDYKVVLMNHGRAQYTGILNKMKLARNSCEHRISGRNYLIHRLAKNNTRRV